MSGDTSLNDYFCVFRRVLSFGKILGALRDMCDSNRHHACSANELPLEALKHSVIRNNCIGNTFGCVLAVCTWCRSGQRGKSRIEMERDWKGMTELTGKYQRCVCLREREREREMSFRQTPPVWTVRSRCKTAAPVCVRVCVCVCVNECECVSMAVSVYVRDETVIWSGWERCKAIAFWVINAHTHKVNWSGHRNVLLLC